MFALTRRLAANNQPIQPNCNPVEASLTWLEQLGLERQSRQLAEPNTENNRQWLLATCPSTGEEVVGQYRAIFPLAGQSAGWWRCPACRGWHVRVEAI